ncbi:hypothetical protein PSA7680_03527 [Pseudoruegeria aquimaris]|uniref:DUF1365 domain-containing protein n=1 Tax=Pseudoruegeria aquimaris TaxID=393663 RepID=A0A1Y5TRN3_9RHOB|nr:DUF1365 domain-containing protein [Pseudoruegeria aquimaris]SLN66627.1 hypothetical protein PSA7680_03527 [Pseudoruegeria aquimaris]
MSFAPLHIAGETCHARRGGIANAFRYGVDFLLIDPDAPARGALFSRNRFNLASVHDADHGGARGAGEGAAWARRVFAERGLAAGSYDLRLLTQPRCLGYTFNPVSFWLAQRDGALLAVIAEVNNTFGGRHCYFCANPDLRPITPANVIEAEKIFYVSPFQEIAGHYVFRFRIEPGEIAIRITLENGKEGVVATLTGKTRPLTSAGLAHALLLRRPLGALRTVFLIYRQALRLRLRGATYRRAVPPPAREVS